MINPLIVCALKDEFNIETGQYSLLHTGVGKVNAAISLTEYMLLNKKPSFVINYGTAGSKKLDVGELIDCTKFIQRDMDASKLGFDKFETPFDGKNSIEIDNSYILQNPTKKFLTCATGDNFLASSSVHPGDVVDMEAYALAKVCAIFSIPFISFKYISDSADSDANVDWELNLHEGKKAFIKDILKPLSLFENKLNKKN